MTDLKNPREWYLDLATEYGDPCDFVSTEPHECPAATNIHVIEYGAYSEAIKQKLQMESLYARTDCELRIAKAKIEKLEAENAKLKEALKFYAKQEGHEA
jgi:hypothetical protein